MAKQNRSSEVVKGSDPTVPVSSEATRAMKYAILQAMHPEWSKRRCARAAGYSSRSNTGSIDKTLGVQAATRTVSEYRQLVKACPETSFGALVAQLAGIALSTTGKGRDKQFRYDARERRGAIRQLSGMLGYEAPDQIQVEARGMLVELSAYGSEDLAAIKAALAGGAA